MPSKKKDDLTLEQMLIRLDEISALLDSDLELDKALSLYEEGVSLIKSANKMITDAEAKIKTGDALMYLSSAFERFDIAFLDPPYAAEQLPVVLPAVSKVMREGGIVLCETAKNIDLPEEAGNLFKEREYRYGSTKVLMYKCKED